MITTAHCTCTIHMWRSQHVCIGIAHTIFRVYFWRAHFHVWNFKFIYNILVLLLSVPNLRQTSHVPTVLHFYRPYQISLDVRSNNMGSIRERCGGCHPYFTFVKIRTANNFRRTDFAINRRTRSACMRVWGRMFWSTQAPTQTLIHTYIQPYILRETNIETFGCKRTHPYTNSHTADTQITDVQTDSSIQTITQHRSVEM